MIRQVAQVGDWIVGLKEVSDENENHTLVFIMQITEKLTYNEYWNNQRFTGKIPDFSIEDYIQQLGDNIYKPIDDDFEQIYSLHSREFFDNDDAWLKQKKEDLQGKYVLISEREHYFYFGKDSVKLPTSQLIDLLYCNIGYKCIADPKVPQEFLDFIVELKKQDKTGFISQPENWPKDDDSYLQCLIDEKKK